jgi:hypothetical protein
MTVRPRFAMILDVGFPFPRASGEEEKRGLRRRCRACTTNGGMPRANTRLFCLRIRGEPDIRDTLAPPLPYALPPSDRAR